MKGVSFITTNEGIKTGIVLDFKFLQNKKNHQHELEEYLEELTDLIYIELHKDDENIDWELAKQDLKAKGILSKHV